MRRSGDALMRRVIFGGVACMALITLVTLFSFHSFRMPRRADDTSESLSLEQRVARLEREINALTDSSTEASTTTTRAAEEASPSASTFKQTVVIPASCLPYQKYQQVVAVMSLRRMQRLHPHLASQMDVTRVISCHDPEASASTFPDARLSSFYVAPDFALEVGKSEALTLNKPGALWKWISDGPGRLLPDDHELVIVDADFLFLNAAIPYPMSQVGQPAAAHFQLGPFNTKPEVMKFCEGKCEHYTRDWLLEHEVGPPIAIRKVDAVRMLREWFRITKAMMMEGDPGKAYSWPGDWMADMYAYMFASEATGLRHSQTWGWFLVNQFEKWHKIKDLSVSWCFHYAGNFRLSDEVKDGTEIWFHKHQYKSPKTVEMMLSCDKEESIKMWSHADRGEHKFNPPDWLSEAEFPTKDLWDEDSSVHKAARMKWIMYTLYHGINGALEEYRQLVCHN